METEVHARDFSLALHWGAGRVPKTIRVFPHQIPGNIYTCLRPYADRFKFPQNLISIPLVNGCHVENTHKDSQLLGKS